MPNINKPHQKVSRPNISGSGDYVTRPNVSKHLAEYEARKAEEAKAVEEYVSPEEAQAKQIAYLERAVSKLQKELKALRDDS